MCVFVTFFQTNIFHECLADQHVMHVLSCNMQYALTWILVQLEVWIVWEQAVDLIELSKALN